MLMVPPLWDYSIRSILTFLSLGERQPTGEKNTA